jgi:hypothetical protein
MDEQRCDQRCVLRLTAPLATDGVLVPLVRQREAERGGPSQIEDKPEQFKLTLDLPKTLSAVLPSYLLCFVAHSGNRIIIVPECNYLKLVQEVIHIFVHCTAPFVNGASSYSRSNTGRERR